MIVNSNHKPPVIPDVTTIHFSIILTPSPVILVLSTGMTSDQKIYLKDIASKLVSEISITRLLVEAGEVLITELLKHDLIDRLIVCRSGKI